ARVPCRVIDLPAALEARMAHVNTPDELSAYERQRHGRWLQIVGYSGVGKTVLLSHLISRLAAEGESVTAVKLTHHAIQSHPGGDSGKLRLAGAEAAWLAGPDGLFREGAPDPDAVKRLARGMWLVVEGGRHWPTPKIVLGGDRWPEHAAPIVGSVGHLPPLAARHLTTPMPEGASRAAAWIFERRFLLSAPLSEVAHG
ncbi:MAG: molybdopterin-guanine dinucleotide biosynthesis protein MobB, partial [Clostridia bacterium]